MKFELRDFRCFHEPKPVQVRPINLLVGENSAGKTSFLAAVRFIFEFLRRHPQPSFNKEPFQLGAFDQIAHYRGGRFGRAKSFSFEVTEELPRVPRAKRQLELFSSIVDKGEPTQYNMKVIFHDRKGQPSVKRIEFTAGGYGFNFTVDESMALQVRTPSNEMHSFSDSLTRGRLELIQDVVSYADFALRDLRFLMDKADAPPSAATPDTYAQFLVELEYLSDLYRRVQRIAPHSIYASAPVRSKPERTYNVEDARVAADGGHVPFVLAELHSFEPEKWKSIEKSMHQFGAASGLFDSVQVRRIGRGAGDPFQILVNLKGMRSNIIDVGYGVSQALPIITDLLRMHQSYFLFQQPEVHLHPKAQAELGSFFASVAKAKKHTLFIETHSDYLIDRIRMEIRAGDKLKSDDVSIMYFEKRDHDTEIHGLKVDPMGNILGAPVGYRSFFLEEESRSLGVGEEDVFNN